MKNPFRILTTPFLLKRLVRSNEDIARELKYLNSILSYKLGITGEVTEEAPEDDADISYAGGHEAVEVTQRDRQRARNRARE